MPPNYSERIWRALNLAGIKFGDFSQKNTVFLNLEDFNSVHVYNNYTCGLWGLKGMSPHIRYYI